MRRELVLALAAAGLLACTRGGTDSRAVEPAGDLTPVIDEVKRVRRDLDRIQGALQSDPRQPRATLDALAAVELKPAVRQVYAGWLARLPPETAIWLVAFGIHSERLAAQADRLTEQGQKDLLALERAEDAARFAVRVQAPDQSTQAPAGAEVIEIGAAICKEGGKPTPVDQCQGAPWGFLWRRDPGSAWIRGQIAEVAPGAAAVATDRLLPLLPTAVFPTAGGAEPSLAQLRYRRGVAELAEEVAGVIELGKKLEQELTKLKVAGS